MVKRSYKSYIGIENELTSFNKDGCREYFYDRFRFMRDKMPGKKFNQEYASIRTNTGNGYYADGEELEILTPPIVLNPGFAGRLTDSLLIGRDSALKATPDFTHTGYSMHWNVTNHDYYYGDFFRGIKFPFTLFGNTPLSIGTAIRGSSERFELMGDSLSNEDQIKATALMVGAYCLSQLEGDPSPISKLTIDPRFCDGLDGEIVRLDDGRFTLLNGEIKETGFNGSVYLQQALELFNEWLKPYTKALGTPEEVALLDDFVSGKRQLEMDRIKFFKRFSDLGGREDDTGIYLPIKIKTPDGFTKILTPSGRNVELPLEARLLGEIVNIKSTEIAFLGWTGLSIQYIDSTGELINQTIRGVDGIYHYAEKLTKQKSNVFPEFEVPEVNPNRLRGYKFSEEIKYDASKDNSLSEN